MSSIKCYDIDGRLIKAFHQYDVNQKLVIGIEEFGFTDLSSVITPIVYFCNRYTDIATPVQSTMENEKIIVDIPNKFLEVSVPMEISFYFTSKNDSSSKRTLAYIKIPVINLKEFSNYLFEDNSDEYTYSYSELVSNMLTSTARIDTIDLKETQLSEKLNNIGLYYKDNKLCVTINGKTVGNSVEIVGGSGDVNIVAVFG